MKEYLYKEVKNLTAYELKDLIIQAIRESIPQSNLTQLQAGIGKFLDKLPKKDGDIIC